MSTSCRVSNSRKKKSKKVGAGDTNEDYISNLPEDVISHILSCLSTKDAVRTSVLSKDWEFMWTSIHDIRIIDRFLLSRKGNNETSFVNFMERLLLLTGKVTSFNLVCIDKYDSSRMESWMSSVLRRNVESLKIFYGHRGIVLPCIFLNSTSLIKLSLNLPCTFKVAAKNCFPNLRDLYVDGVEIVNEISNTDPLIFTFPVLKTFELIKCKWLNVKFVEINVPVLTEFKSESPYSPEDNIDYSIKILGARLAKFKSSGGLPENFTLSGSPVVYAALRNQKQTCDLQLLGKIGLQVQRMLKGFSHLKNLEISGWLAKTIPVSRAGFDRLSHDKLRQLVLHTPCDTATLLELLHSAPFLKILVMDMIYWEDYDYDAVESVPSCIVSHLEELKFNLFLIKTPQLNLAEFFLKNGVELKKFYVRSVNYCERNLLAEMLSTCFKASTCLKIVVS